MDLVTDDGCRLWTTRTGTGEPLVLCHGGPGFWDTFEDLAGLLADVAAVHRWDQRGCGRSERRGPYTVARGLPTSTPSSAITGWPARPCSATPGVPSWPCATPWPTPTG
jgi:pimeloyl-ACP methyl ester carboxylesterase